MALGKRVRTVFCIFLPSILLLALFPFYIVKADNATYLPVESGCFIYGSDDGTDSTLDTVNLASGHEYRSVVLHTSTKDYFFVVSLTSFAYEYHYRSCTVDLRYTSKSSTYNGNTFYYYDYNRNGAVYNSDIPKVNINTYDLSYAYRYTFGDLSVDPEPEISYGDLIIEGYSTDIAGQGEASINNIDHIKWNGYIDSNGNDISNCKVRLQIVPGKYTGTSKNDLTNKTRQDFIIDPINASDSLFDANIGEVSFSWRDIVNTIDIIPYRLYSLELFGPDWQKDGWIYKLRLEDEENDYIGEWQTVYSSTSNGVQNDLNITNITTINQTLVQTFQELNSLNNVENNWVFNNTEISVENNYTEPSSGQKPWWAYLLESILNTFNITNNYINNGNEGTQTIVNNVNDSDDNMNNKIDEYQQYEDNFIDDMDSNLTDIDTNVDFLSDNKFIASANWVAQQYNRMTNNNIIGSFIGFSLLFGLALIFIGKIH